MTEFGRGYDAAQVGMLKAIETAERIARIRERKRIIAILTEEMLHYKRTPAFNYRSKLMELITQIGYENE